MTVRISAELVASPPVDFPVHCPVIGWETHITNLNISADSEAATAPASNLAYPDTIDVWESESTSVQYVTIETTGAYGFLGLVGHNLGTDGSTLAVEGDDGGGFDDLGVSLIPGDDGPIMFIFEQTAFEAIRLKITPVTTAPTIASMMAGPLLKIPRGIQPGHTPILDGHDIRMSNGIAQDGNYLGGIILHEALRTQATILDLDGEWYRENMRRFIDYANGGLPFYFAWAPHTQPEEIGYCHFQRRCIPVIGQRIGTFDIDMALGGIATL